MKSSENIENIDNNTKIAAFIDGLGTPNDRKVVYYTEQFNRFNFNGITMFKLSWNWAAFFLSWIHLIYRKMYAFGIILGGINLFLAVKFFVEFNNKVAVDRNGLGYIDPILVAINAAAVFFIFGISVCCGLLSNFFIYLRYNKEAKKAKKFISEDLKQVEYLKMVGGRNKIIEGIVGGLLGPVYIIVNAYLFLYYMLIISIKILLIVIDIQ